MNRRRIGVAATLLAALAMTTGPAFADCSGDDPECRLKPPPTRQLNPHPATADFGHDGPIAAGVLRPSPVMPLVPAEVVPADDPGPPAVVSRAPSISTLEAEDPRVTSEVEFHRLVTACSTQPASCDLQVLAQSLAKLDGQERSVLDLLRSLRAGKATLDQPLALQELTQAADATGFGNASHFAGWSFVRLRQELATGKSVLVLLNVEDKPPRAQLFAMYAIDEERDLVLLEHPAIGTVSVPITDFVQRWKAGGARGLIPGAPTSPSEFDSALPLLALATGLMAIASSAVGETKRNRPREKPLGVGKASSALDSPPDPPLEPWIQVEAPVYQTRRVRDGWKTVTRRKPKMETRRVKVGEKTVYDKVPRSETKRVRAGWRNVSVNVPRFKTVRYVKGYTYRKRLVRAGKRWKTMLKRVPKYGMRRVKTGTRTVIRRLPKYMKKKVVSGYKLVPRRLPRYESRQVQVGWTTVEKRVPRYVERRVKVGTEMRWVRSEASEAPAPTPRPERAQPPPTPQAPTPQPTEPPGPFLSLQPASTPSPRAEPIETPTPATPPPGGEKPASTVATLQLDPLPLEYWKYLPSYQYPVVGDSFPFLKTAVIEAGSRVGTIISGHNNGVVGFDPKKPSLKIGNVRLGLSWKGNTLSMSMGLARRKYQIGEGLGVATYGQSASMKIEWDGWNTTTTAAYNSLSLGIRSDQEDNLPSGSFYQGVYIMEKPYQSLAVAEAFRAVLGAGIILGPRAFEELSNLTGRLINPQPNWAW